MAKKPGFCVNFGQITKIFLRNPVSECPKTAICYKAKSQKFKKKTRFLFPLGTNAIALR